MASGICGIPDMVRVWSRKSPDKAALIEADRVVTYAQLDHRSNRIANALTACDVGPGSRVGYLGKNSAAFFEIWIGVNKAGCSFTPLNWRCAPAEVTDVVHDADMSLIFAGSDFTELADRVRQATDIAVQVIPQDELDQWSSRADAADPRIALSQTTTALLAYTSGTTAAPKGVPISHGALGMWFRAAATERSVDWNSDDVGLTVMPNFHLAGTWVSLSALYDGASLAILPAFEPAAFVAAVAAHRPTVTCLVPTAIQLLLDHASAQPADFSSLRRLLYAGSPIGQHTLQQALDVFGCDFVQFYGTTETFIVTLLRPEQHRVDDPALLKSCGQPMPGAELRIVDPNGRDVPPGVPGEVLVQSPWMFSGYLNRPEATATAIVDGWYHTGDAGIRDKEGNLFLVDRMKDMIVSGGENIYSAEVERALTAHPSVVSVAVVGAPDEKWGERVVAFVVPHPGRPVDVSELVSHCRGLIAGYKVPKEIHLTDALPLTATGKVQKAALRQQLREDRGSDPKSYRRAIVGYQSIFTKDLFADRTVVITGGASGIGRCTAHELAALGADVAIVGRNVDKLEAVQAEIHSDGGRVSIHTADIRDEATVSDVVDAILAAHGRIDGLFNNAGGQYRAALETISTKGFEAVVRNNLTGGFIVMREVYTKWMKAHGGAIVNMIADIWHGWPHFAHSASARGGMLSLSESAATEWAAAGVRVNTIAPGSIASSGLDTYDSKDTDFIRNKVASEIPLQRFGTEAEVSAAVVFLLSPAASFITGTCIRVDGGAPNAKPGWWDLQPVEHNVPFDGFHRSALPAILDANQAN